jgi:hypothetical protein
LSCTIKKAFKILLVDLSDKLCLWLIFYYLNIIILLFNCNKDRGFDPEFVNKPKPYGWSPMLQCAEEGNLLMLIWLFEKDGCNVEDLRRADDAGITPLQLASMRRGKRHL